MADEANDSFVVTDLKKNAFGVFKWVFTGFVLVLGSWFGVYQGLTLEIAEVRLDKEENLRIYESRIAVMVQEYAETLLALNEEVTTLRTELRILRFKSEIESSLTPESVLRNVLNAIPAPSWCKMVVIKNMTEVQFVMDHVNGRFQNKYQITNQFYKGKTDSQARVPDEQAEEWYKNDLTVYHNRASLVTFETSILPGGRAISTRNWKFYVKTIYGDEFICGSIIEIVDETVFPSPPLSTPRND